MNGGRPGASVSEVFARGLTPWVVVALAAILPYSVTIFDYFVRDDFGVVQLLAQKPLSYFPAVVRELVDGRDLGIRAR